MRGPEFKAQDPGGGGNCLLGVVSVPVKVALGRQERKTRGRMQEPDMEEGCGMLSSGLDMMLLSIAAQDWPNQCYSMTEELCPQ